MVELVLSRLVKPLRNPLADFGVVVGFVIYQLSYLGVYTETGSVNEWVRISTAGFDGPHVSYFSYTLTLPSLARAIGVSTPEQWRTLTLSIAFVAISLIVVLASRISETSLDFLVSLCVLAFLPVSQAVLNGQADYDGLMLLFAIGAILSHSPFIAMVFGLLLGFTNSEQAMFTTVALVFTMFAVSDKRIRIGLSIFAGAGIGLVVGRLLFLNADFPPRTEFVRFLPISWLKDSFIHIYGAVWLLLAATAYLVFQGLDRKSLRLIAGLVGLVVLPLIANQQSGDGIRVVALVTLPSVFICLNFVLRNALKTKALIFATVLVGHVIYLSTIANDAFPLYFPTIAENLFSG